MNNANAACPNICRCCFPLGVQCNEVVVLRHFVKETICSVVNEIVASRHFIKGAIYSGVNEVVVLRHFVIGTISSRSGIICKRNNLQWSRWNCGSNALTMTLHWDIVSLSCCIVICIADGKRINLLTSKNKFVDHKRIHLLIKKEQICWSKKNKLAGKRINLMIQKLNLLTESNKFADLKQ